MNFRSLDLNLLRVFDAVMAERNLTRAAERLAMTQPAVSNALKRLRESVGEELLIRTAFGVKPTPYAEVLWSQVRAALGQLRHAFEPGEYDPLTEPVTFRLAMADATAALLLPGLVSHIEKTKALANLRVLPLTTRDPRALLEHGDADFAIGYFPEAVSALVAQGSLAPLHHERLYDSEYVCVMRRDHPLADTPLTLDVFCEANHLLVSFSGRAHGFVDQALSAIGRTRRIVLTVNQFFTAGRVVAHSDLLTVLPASFLESTGYQRQLVSRPIPLALSGIHVEVLWHLRHDRDSSHRWMRERLVEAGKSASPAPAMDDRRGRSAKAG
ncbi:MAG: LysR family transcriptional regulator [Rhizobacter sp.]|nr:LysR family transcriptional regulator [Rhizobacter sp.]